MNSEVLLFGSVAVAVTNSPAGNGTFKTVVNCTLPFASVGAFTNG